MIKRVFELDKTEARKIRARQRCGTMEEYYDDDCYICYDTKEYENWRPSKVGRKPKKR